MASWLGRFAFSSARASILEIQELAEEYLGVVADHSSQNTFPEAGF